MLIRKVFFFFLNNNPIYYSPLREAIDWSVCISAERQTPILTNVMDMILNY